MNKLQNWLHRLFGVLQGRTTAFFIAFFCTGNLLQWLHRLDANYIGFMATLLSAIIGHSVKEDYFNKPDNPDADVKP
jgi:hypothetical protein